jgi:hypothetical protein
MRFFDIAHLLVFQEIIKTTQIGRFDGHVRRRRKLSARLRQGDRRRGRERLILSQQTPQRVIHRRFALTGGMLQNSQVFSRGDSRRVFIAQPVVGHPKATVGEQILAIAVVLEGARLPWR